MTRFGRIASTLAVLSLGVALAGQAQAQSRPATAPAADRQAQEAACGADAQRYCGPYIPDEQKIASCLRTNLAKLTPACKRMFN